MGCARSKNDSELIEMALYGLHNGKVLLLEKRTYIYPRLALGYKYHDLRLAICSENKSLYNRVRDKVNPTDLDYLIYELKPRIFVNQKLDKFYNISTHKNVSPKWAHRFTHLDLNYKLVCSQEADAKKFDQIISVLKKDEERSKKNPCENPFVERVENCLYVIDKFPKVNKRGHISNETKAKLFRLYAGGTLDAKCFCCDTPLTMERAGDISWECGHILSVKHGGDSSLENLRIVCQKCNRECQEIHLFEYMALRGQCGLKNLDEKDRVMYVNLVKRTQEAHNHIDNVFKLGIITHSVAERIHKNLDPTVCPPLLRVALVDLLLI